MPGHLHIPDNYDVWLTDLKHHLDRHPGSKAALARHLAAVRDLKPKGASVTLLKILRGDSRPGVDVFLDLAAWLQRQRASDGAEPMRIEWADEPEPIGPRREVRYVTGGSRKARVVES